MKFGLEGTCSTEATAILDWSKVVLWIDSGILAADVDETAESKLEKEAVVLVRTRSTWPNLGAGIGASRSSSSSSDAVFTSDCGA